MSLFPAPTLSRYLALRFIRSIAVVFLTVFTLIYLLDLVELIRRTSDIPEASTIVLAKLSLFRTPAVAEQVFPFAVLFGAMVALLDLSRKLELVVARAAGVSAWQFLLSPILVAALLGMIMVGGYNPVSARLKDRAAAMETKLTGRNRDAGLDNIWIRQRSVDGQAIIRANSADMAAGHLTGVTVFAFELSGAFQQRIEGAEAKLKHGYWEISDARVSIPGVEPELHERFQLASNLTEQQLQQSFASADSVPFWSLPAWIARTELAGLDATRYRQHYNALLARPLLFVAMVLIAASVSLRFFRFGGVARMVLGGVAAGFVLYVATKMIEDLGAAGILSTTIAAWSPAVVGSLLGALALLYQEDG
jgi:lipopolysaccharide export system permease protein